MRRYIVTTSVNIDSPFDHYHSTDSLAVVTTENDPAPLALHVRASSPAAAGEAAYDIGNRQGQDERNQRWPSDVRQISKADVLHVASADAANEHQQSFAVESVGLTDLGSQVLPNPIVPIEGTNATSRDS